jgi:hypothetical protein
MGYSHATYQGIQYPGLLALAEKALRPVDRLDYAIRRCVIPVACKKSPSIRLREVPLGLQSSIPYAIGQYLRAQYTIERSLPSALANLLRDFEQRNNQGDAFAKSGYPGTA